MLWGVEMVVKRLKECSFKGQKLEKTKTRRRSSESERRLAQHRELSRRNDLVPDLEIEYIDVAALQVSKHRARRTTPEQLERVAASMADLGFCQPILVCGHEIIDGAIRVEAAQRLGITRVPAIDCSHLSATEVRKLRLATNRIAERGQWDIDLLKIEFQELIDLDADVACTGFSPEELDIILLEPMAIEANDGDEEPQGARVSELGDIWQLGPHRVICGNALEAQTYRSLLNGETAHAVLIDPPYNVKIKNNVSGLGSKVHDEFVMASGELSDDEFQQFLSTVLALLTSLLATGAVLFVFMDWRSMHRVYHAGFAAGLRLINKIIWYKQQGSMGALYRSAYEELVVFCTADKPRTNNVELGRHGRDRANVWIAPGANRKGSSANEMLGQHATPKPVELCVDAILDVTCKGDIVLDAFLGSGTTLIAAEKTGRRCYAVELDPKFVDVSVRRWMGLTGEGAVLCQTRETFGEVEHRRNGGCEGRENESED